ncbi:TPA: hypothetical protein ENX78_13340 [Candidatus Poribacteria bacterium]|nr:hypothetical protein [Candidatus Poribacteria bacterium]
MRYEKPILINLTDIEISEGCYCESGTGANTLCQQGFSAYGGKCGNGTSADYKCKNGSSPTKYCWSGSCK